MFPLICYQLIGHRTLPKAYLRANYDKITDDIFKKGHQRHNAQKKYNSYADCRCWFKGYSHVYDLPVGYTALKISIKRGDFIHV